MQPVAGEVDNQGVLQRIRTFFDGSPHVGDQVTVISGPYRGRPGTIIAVDQDRWTVHIDECCQPRLSRDAFRREWNGRWMRDRQHAFRDNDHEGDWARYYLDQNNR